MQTKKKKKLSDVSSLTDFPLPTSVELVESDYPILKAKGLRPRVLTRLTIVISNNDFLIHYNKSDIAKQYDLLSIVPKSAPCLLALLRSSFRFDILSFDPDLIYNGVVWQRKLYNECVDKYIHFELLYAPMITDRDHRRRIINLAHTYKSVGKSKKVFVSSGAHGLMELRCPADVSNLTFLFGLNEHQGLEAVKQHCTSVYKCALGRKLGVYRVRVEKVPGHANVASSSDSDEMDTD